MKAAYTLEQLAEKKGIPIYEPYCGAQIGNFIVLSPEQDWYIHDLMAEFEKSPDQKKLESTATNFSGILKALTEAAKNAITWIAEEWNKEYLREDVTTTAENESSVILYGDMDGHGLLLTGDAGVRALSATAYYAESKNFSLPNNLSFIQIPHHGSRHNVSTTVLDRIVGLRKSNNDGQTTKTAFVSAGKESTSHPRIMVTNAFIRRGAKVVATQGEAKRHFKNMPKREGWSAVAPIAYSNQVESWD